MAKKPRVRTKTGKSLVALRTPELKAHATAPEVHTYGKKVRCDTDSRGYRTPNNVDLTRLVVDASDGFIPLWAPNVTLRWRFKQSSLDAFENPAGLASAVEDLFAKALIAWGDAVPVKFAKRKDNHDFQIVVRSHDDCDVNGCVLASAFFPDAGRHEFVIYPEMFEQSDQEQLETMCHELGHVFGLRHFFAQVSETGFPSEIFGVHNKFTIMNYGPNSVLTEDDKKDLKRLYEGVWRGEITQINGTPVRIMKPFSSLATLTDGGASPSFAPSMPVAAAVSPQLAYIPTTRLLANEVIYARR